MRHTQPFGELAGRREGRIEPCQQLALEALHRIVEIPLEPLVDERHGLGGHRHIDLLGTQLIPFQQGHGPIKTVAQLAHVAGPAIGGQVIGHVAGKARTRALQLAGKAGDKLLGQRHDVRLALAQGRQTQTQHVEAIVEIFPKLAFMHQIQQLLLGGADEAHIDLHLLLVAHPAKYPVLQHPQELGLQMGRHVADLVQHQGAAARQLQHAALALGVVAKGSGGIAKQLALGHVVRHGGAVESHEGVAGAQAGAVTGTGQQLLAGTGLADNEQRGILHRQLAGLGQYLFHLGALGLQMLKAPHFHRMKGAEMHADPTGGLEYHHGAGQGLSALLLGHEQRHQIRQILLAMDGEFAGLGLDLARLQPATEGEALDQGAQRHAAHLLHRQAEGGERRLVGLGHLALAVEGEDQIRQRLEQRLDLVVFPFGGHVGDGLDVIDAGNAADLRHQVLEITKLQLGKVEIDDAWGIDFDAAQIDVVLHQAVEQFPGQAQAVFTADFKTHSGHTS